MLTWKEMDDDCSKKALKNLFSSLPEKFRWIWSSRDFEYYHASTIVWSVFSGFGRGNEGPIFLLSYDEPVL